MADKQPFFSYGAASGAFVFSDLGMIHTRENQKCKSVAS